MSDATKCQRCGWDRAMYFNCGPSGLTRTEKRCFACGYDETVSSSCPECTKKDARIAALEKDVQRSREMEEMVAYENAFLLNRQRADKETIRILCDQRDILDARIAALERDLALERENARRACLEIGDRDRKADVLRDRIAALEKEPERHLKIMSIWLDEYQRDIEILKARVKELEAA